MGVTLTSSNSSLSPHQVNAYHTILRNDEGDENTRRDTKILRNFVPRFHGVEIMEVDGEGIIYYRNHSIFKLGEGSKGDLNPAHSLVARLICCQ